MYRGMTHCFYHVVRHEGAGALMRGIVPNLVKAAPAAAVNFAMYDWIRSLYAGGGGSAGREGTNLDNYFQRPGGILRNPFISPSRDWERRVGENR